MQKLAVLTSGGDSPGMNAALRAVAKMAAARGVHVYGVLEGWEGLIHSNFRELTRQLPNGSLTIDSELEAAGSIGGTLIGSARSARFREPEGRARAASHFEEGGFDGLLVIGGNGSLTGAHIFAVEHGVRVIGMPGSIDNDIGCTSMALGVDTALNTIVEACDRISDTARAHRRAFMVEVMGRDCGYLAMSSAVATAADAVLIRESGKTEEQLVSEVVNIIRIGIARGKRRILIIKAEGIQMPCTKLARVAEEVLGAELGNTEIRATVLGHVVRGGSPSYADRSIAGRLGFAAVNAIIQGRTDEMVAWHPNVEGGVPTDDNAIFMFPLERVIKETNAIIDGTSPVTKRRIALMARASDVLAL